MSEPVNHEEAEHLAILKQGESNLARCYLDTVKALRHIIAMAGNPDAVDACRLIINRAKQTLGEK